MNATSSPQTAAEQARKNYRDVMTPDTPVPEAVRAMAEKAFKPGGMPHRNHRGEKQFSGIALVGAGH